MTATGALGAWAGDDLGATARRYLGAGADAMFEPPVRMLSAVARIASARFATPAVAGDPPDLAVFLLSPTPPVHVAGGARLEPVLDSGGVPLAGRVWFVSQAPHSGHYVTLGNRGYADAFQFVREELACGDLAAVVLDPTTSPPTARFYEQGIAEPDRCVVIPIDATGPVEMEDIVGVADDLYRTLLASPSMQTRAGRVWISNRRARPVKDAEDRIQMHLATALKVRFPACEIRPEQPGPAGRLDIQIDRKNELATGGVTVFAVIELKVLRTYWSSGAAVSDSANVESVESGLEQAVAYQLDRSAMATALFCFDMRETPSGEAILDPIRSDAALNGVALRLWYLFSTASSYRGALMKALAGRPGPTGTPPAVARPPAGQTSASS